MPYVKAVVDSGNVIEVSKYYSARIGSKTVKQEIKETKPTPEKQKAWEKKNAERKVWRLLRENFEPGDLWITLTYPGGTRPTLETIRKNVRAWQARMRRLNEKAGLEFNYILTAGRGKHGAAHIHAVINAGVPIDKISQAWEDITGGRVDFKILDRSRNWKKVAEYIIKNSEEDRQSEEPVFKKRYLASRNLVMPKISRRLSRAESWKKEPPAKAGYAIDQDSSYTAIEETESGRMVKKQYTVYVRINWGKEKANDNRRRTGAGRKDNRRGAGSRKRTGARRASPKKTKAPPRHRA